MHVDLNADLGESFGNFIIGEDAALMPFITSANVAAGFHGGDPSVIRRTIRLAITHGVQIGAHPSYPDVQGFGRREIQMSDWEVEDAVLYQIASVAGIARAEGATLRHVKPHGALYNVASRDPRLADAVARAIAAFDSTLVLFAPPESALAHAGRAARLPVAREGFADRRYRADGTLAPRNTEGAVIDDAELAAAQALSIVRQGRAVALDGTPVALTVDTLCVHGDHPGAAVRAARVRAALEAAAVSVRAPRR